jgi:hypothetical protein
VFGRLLGSVESCVLEPRPLFRITIPLGIGSELWEFKPCAEPVCGEGDALYAALGGVG